MATLGYTTSTSHGSNLSSCCGLAVRPSGGFVVEGAVSQAYVKDPDPPVPQSSECLMVGVFVEASLIVCQDVDMS